MVCNRKQAFVENEASTVGHGIWGQLLVNKWVDEHLRDQGKSENTKAVYMVM